MHRDNSVSLLHRMQFELLKINNLITNTRISGGFKEIKDINFQLKQQ